MNIYTPPIIQEIVCRSLCAIKGGSSGDINLNNIEVIHRKCLF